MSDDNLPVSTGTPPIVSTNASIEEDFPTLKAEAPTPPAPTPIAPPVFTPLGGTTPDTISGGTTQLAHLQYTPRPNLLGSFDTLEKVVTDVPGSSRDAIPTTVNIFPDSVPQTNKSTNPLILVGFLIFIFLLISAFAGAVYAIAYDVIKLNNPSISKPISDFVQGLPFSPKTPEYLIKQTALAQRKISKESYEFSVAIRSRNLQSVFGSNTVEAASIGSIDYSDLKNVKFSSNVSITKDFNADIRSTGPIVYFKINKLPLNLLAMVGLSEEDTKPLIADWISYDTTPLGTEAKNLLDDKATQKTPTQEFTDKFETIIFDDQILKNITTTDDHIGKTDVYKITLRADTETIDYLEKAANREFSQTANVSQTKASDIFKDLEISMWIERGNYNLRKLTASFTIEDNTANPSLGTQKSTSDVAFTYNLADIGKDFKVELPQDSITSDKFILRIQQKMAEIYQSKNPDSTSGQTPPTLNYSNFFQ